MLKIGSLLCVGNYFQVIAIFFLTFFVFPLAFGEANAVVFYVAPNGNDAWSGLLEKPDSEIGDGPLASIQGARDRVREFKKQEALTESIRVVFAGGHYPLHETIVFSPEDSGTEAFPIVYEAAREAKPVFTGSRAISNFKITKEGLWTTRISDVSEGTWYFEQLWVNGKRAVRARSPNQNYFHIAGTVNEEKNKQAFMARLDDVEELLRDIPSERLNDVTVIAYHAWETSRHRISDFDPDSGLITLTGQAPWPFLQFDIYQRYHLENLREALDEPGEWYLDHSGSLYYMPRVGEELETAVIEAPIGPERFIHFYGTPEQPVANIKLKGLSFRHGQYVLPPGGHGDAQAEISISAVIEGEGSSGIILENCEVAHVGIHAVWFHNGSRNCQIIDSYIHDIGAGGIRIGDSFNEDQSNQFLRTENILVENTIIHGGGRIHAGGCGIWIGNSGHNRITHNDISDLFYTGISVGWVWGYKPSLAVDNRIEFNHIHHIGRGGLDDMGGIYTLGPSSGTVIRNNVVHDVYAYRYGGWGLYNDEGSSDIILENNLVYETGNGSYHLHYGRNNLVRNNILCNSKNGQIQRSRVEMQMSLYFTNNIVCWEQGPLVAAGSILGRSVVFKNNLYWKDRGVDVDFQGQTLNQRQAAGQDLGSLVADPLFVDSSRGDFRILSGSPVERIGFKPFDPALAGVYGSMATIVATFEFEEVEPQPPFSLSENFDRTPSGARPAFAHCFTGGREDLVAITDAVGVDGGRSLAISDAKGLKYPYLPYIYYDPDHRQGVTVFSFDMRVDEGTDMYHEWRDNNVPYGVGPSFSVRNGQLKIGGRSVLDLPLGVFTNFRVIASLGKDSTGTWDLEVKIPGQGMHQFKSIKNGSLQWQHLNWLGFSSMAVKEQVFYLDNLHVVSMPAR